MEEKDNPVENAVRDEDELDSILNLQNLPRTVPMD